MLVLHVEFNGLSVAETTGRVYYRCGGRREDAYLAADRIAIWLFSRSDSRILAAHRI